MESKFHIQNEEGRLRAISRFCYTTAGITAVYIFVLFFMHLPLQAFVMAGITLAFYAAALLNRYKYQNYSKPLIIFATNFAIFYYSVAFGYSSGVHLYLYTTPFIVFLLYNFNERQKIIWVFAIFLLNFLLIFATHRYELIIPISIPPNYINILYVLNFVFSLIQCFTLIIYFALNTIHYTKALVEANKSLQEQQGQLQKEVGNKNKINDELMKTLKLKDILLQEIHHRVKNNLAVISGLVELQNFYVKDEKASAILKESRNRIKSIALLHEKFYENKNLEKIEIRAYVDELIYFIDLSFSNQDKHIRLHAQIDNVELTLTEALPFSLLINELVTNSYKHAFKDRSSGNMYISLIKRGNDVVFHFKDDGSGFDYTNFAKDNSLGMNLVEAFSKQLKGKMQYASERGKGVDFKLYFKVA